MNEFHKPYQIQVSLVSYGCTRRCVWCAFRTLPKDTKPIYIKTSLAYKIADDIGDWLEKIRIDFSPFGEQFLHKNIFDILSYFADTIKNPYLIVYSNGDLLDEEKIKEFFMSGGNQLGIDPYDQKTYDRFIRIIKENKDLFDKLGVNIILYDSEKHNFKYNYHRGKKKRYLLIMDTLRNPRGTRVFNSMGGNVDMTLVKKHGIYIDDEMKQNKYCVRPFREFQIRSDGTIPLCCYDWRADCIIGKYPDDGSLEEIWYSEAFMAVRAILRHHRTIPPCDLCTYHGGYRIGLEPKIDFKDPEIFLAKHQEKYRHLKLSNAREWKVTKRNTLFSILLR